jgi:hypothetical protein
MKTQTGYIAAWVRFWSLLLIAKDFLGSFGSAEANCEYGSFYAQGMYLPFVPQVARTAEGARSISR